MRKRVRFGIRVPIFVNAATFVFYMGEETAFKFQESIVNAAMLLRMAGQDRIADRLVCEVQ
jgi:hypothetical protein